MVQRRGELKLVGIRRHYRLTQDLAAVMHAVARQWKEFHAREAALKHGAEYYGVCLKIEEGDAGFDYLCGVADEGGPVVDFTAIKIPPLRYAVFWHPGATASLPATYFAIFGRLLPEAGLLPADSSSGVPEFIERFDQRYDLATGAGGPEILVPLKG